MYIYKIFESIHGEVNGHHQGRRVTFIRTMGCNLNCSYCDTPETQNFLNRVGTKGVSKEDMYMTHDAILDVVKGLKNKYVCITGGEPAMQHGLINLLYTLWSNGYKVSMETNGSMYISDFFRYVESFVVDFKMEYKDEMIHDNYKLRPSDVIKFVIKDEHEFRMAKVIMEKIKRDGTEAVFAFSPVWDSIQPKELYTLMERYAVHNAVLSLQIHKIMDLE